MDINYLTPNEAALLGGAAGGIIATSAIIILVWYILLVIASWKIFKKAGEPGWKAIIPVYNIYIMYKIVNMQGWFWGLLGLSILAYIITGTTGFNVYIFDANTFTLQYNMPTVLIVSMCIISVLSIIIGIMYAYRTSKVFGHGLGYTIGLIFLPNLFWLILGFGKSKYNKKLLTK